MKPSIVALANNILLSPFNPASIDPSIAIDPTQKIKLAEINPSENLFSSPLINFFIKLAKSFNFPSRSNSSPIITPNTREIIETIILRPSWQTPLPLPRRRGAKIS